MRILFDLQAVQGGSRHRGLGRYSLEFAAALAQSPRVEEVGVLLNGGGALDAVLEARSRIRSRIPTALIHVFDAPWPWDGDHSDPASHARAEAVRTEMIREIAPDLVVVCSLFEGADESVISVPEGPRPFTAVIAYDVLPLTDPASRPESGVPPVYLHRLESFKRADVALAISDYSASEIRAALGSAAPPLRTIWGAPFPLETSRRGARRGLLCVGGDTPRKNERSTIDAFSLLPSEIRLAHPLTLSGRRRASEEESIWAHARSRGLSETEFRVIGRELTDRELADLYSSARLVVMPSLGEGLGLPVLEAWSLGTPAVASSTTSLGEIVGDPRFTFDPLDPSSQAALLGHLLGDDHAWREAHEFGQARLSEFTWTRTADRAWAAIDEFRSAPSPSKVAQSELRPSLAFHTPYPPEKSGIAGHARALAPELEKHYRVTIVNDGIESGRTASEAGFPVIRTREYLARCSEFDRVLFNIGNNHEFHSLALHAMSLTPGVVVSHDLDLVGLVRGVEPPLPASEARLRYREGGLHGVLHGPLPVGIDLYRATLGTIVHSRTAVRGLVESTPAPLDPSRVAHSPLVVIADATRDRHEARNLLGIPDDAILVCTFGRVFPEKRVDVAWGAVDAVSADYPQLMFRAVGQADPRYAEALTARFATSCGELTGGVADDEYALWLAACDVAIQLRATSRGETSAALVEALASGCSLITEDVGSFAEFEDFGVMVVPTPATVQTVTDALVGFMADRQGARSRGEAAAAAVRHVHGAPAVAESYCRHIEAFYDKGGHQAFRTFDPDQALCASRNRLDRPNRTVYWLAGDADPAWYSTWARRHSERFLRVGAASQPHERVFPVRLYGAEVVHDFEAVPDMRNQGGQDGQPAGVWPRPGDLLVIGTPSGQPEVLEPVCTTWRAHGGTVVGLVHDLLPIDWAEFFDGDPDWYARWLSVITRIADHVICPSEATSTRLVEHLGRGLGSRGAQISVIRPGNDVGRVGLPPAALRTRPRGAGRVLAVGSLEPEDGLESLVHAARDLWDGGESMTLVLAVHDGQRGRGLFSAVRSLRDSGARVELLEGVDDADLRWQYLNADLLVAPNWDCGSAGVAVEALLHGVPVLARRKPVFQEVLGDGDHYFRTNGELAHAISVRLRDEGTAILPAIPPTTWQEATRALMSIADSST